MRFVVPQNIDVPEKIIGPFTFSQIVYLLGAGGVSFFLFRLPIPTIIASFLSLIIGILALLLAFYRPFNQHFIVTLRSIIFYFKNSRLFIWKKTQQEHIQIRR